jgi:hypothetical protein
VRAQFPDNVLGIGHAPQHSISERKKQSATLVESRQAIGVAARLQFRFFRSAFSVFVFVFHALPNLMPHVGR